MQIHLIRPWHVIAPNHRASLPRSVVYLDVAPRVQSGQRPGESASRLGEWAALHMVRQRGARWRQESAGQGATAGGWWSWLAAATERCPTTWIVSLDAASSSTWLGLWQHIERERWTIDAAIVDSLPWIVTVAGWHRRWTWLDARNWLPSLSSLDAPSPRERALLLAGVGGELTGRWWHFALGRLSVTAAGCAWSIYRHRHYATPIAVHGVRQALELERQSYRGGRCQCLYVGPIIDPARGTQVDGYIGERDFGRLPRGPVAVYDIRSAYPAVMRGRSYPCELLGVEESCTVSQLRALAAQYATVARVHLQTDRDYPIKGDDGLIRYCRGSLVTALPGPELIRALEDGAVRQVGRVAWYRQARLFDSWVDWIETALTARSGSCDLWRDWIKHLGRCLYGRFGRSGAEWLDCGRSPREHPWGTAWEVSSTDGVYRAVRDLAGRRQRQGDDEEGPDSFPLIPSYVTSYLRVHLDALLLIVGHRQCYYLDTDELHVTLAGARRLRENDCVGTALGQLRLKRSAPDAEYWGPRHYRLGTDLVWAGMGGSRVGVSEGGLHQVVVRERTRSVLARQLDGTVCEQWQPLHPTPWQPPAGVDSEGWVRPLIL